MAHVLIVEDNAALQKIYVTLLTKEGHEVDFANDGQQALEVSSRRWRPIGLLERPRIEDDAHAAGRLERFVGTAEGPCRSAHLPVCSSAGLRRKRPRCPCLRMWRGAVCSLCSKPRSRNGRMQPLPRSCVQVTALL